MAEGGSETVDTNDLEHVETSSSYFEATTQISEITTTSDGSDGIGTKETMIRRRLSYRSESFLYQQDANFFLSLPRPTPTGGVFGWLLRFVGGGFNREPEDMLHQTPPPADHSLDLNGSEEPDLGVETQCKLSPSTQRMLREEVFHDLSPDEVVDYHAHLVGHNDSDTDCFIHPSAKTWRYPVRRIKTAILMSAAQVNNMESGDTQYIGRLLRLVRHYCPKQIVKDGQHGFLSPQLCLLPFDKFYEKDGTENPNKTTLYVPNDYSLKMASEFPHLFHPVGSVNPYRKDALNELEKCAENGIKIIKWLPNSMGIDMRDKECQPFYRKMKKLNLTLLVHVGDEHTVSAAFLDNQLGNPLFLRHPLDCGVKVIAAHCASEGKGLDLDSSAPKQPYVSNYSLFRRLMEEPKYKQLLFGDISAIVGFLRIPYLKTLLDDEAIHDRLVYGSDYPLPCVSALTSTVQMQWNGLIRPEHVPCLKELYNFNPLLYDLALKRVVRGPKGGHFPAKIFRRHPLLQPSVAFSTPV